MVEVGLPFSMPSTTTTTTAQYVLDDRLPSLPIVRHLGQGCDRDISTHAHTIRDFREGDGSNRVQHSLSHTRHGLKTPPDDMTGRNANPLLAPFDGLQYKSVPVVGPNNISYQTHHGPHATPKYTSNSQPFYDSYHSAQRSQSPTSKVESIGAREPRERRRSSSDVNSIVSYLQIPPSINNSKGSLAEFAAQVRVNVELLMTCS